MAKRKGKKLISVDFTGVSVEGGKLLPEGPTEFEVEEINEEVGEDSGQPYLSMKLKVSEEGEYKGTTAYDNFSLQPQSLWKLRGFMEAAGLETVDGPMDIDPDEFVGLIVTGDVVHEPYKGKDKHRINGYSAVEEETTTQPKPSATKAVVKKKPGGKAAEEVEWSVKQKVAFMDGKKRLEGVITELDDDKVTVRVGKEEYEMGTGDLEAA